MKNKWKLIAVIFIITTAFFGWDWSFTSVSITKYNSLVDDYEFCVNATYEWEFAYDELSEECYKTIDENTDYYILQGELLVANLTVTFYKKCLIEFKSTERCNKMIETPIKHK